MSNNEWKKMNDEKFENALELGVSAPTEDIITEVTPWKRSMNRVLIGIALNAITLNFFSLNYILPAIGTILKLLGFRTLRHENKWFKACFTISAVRAVYKFSTLILNTTIYNSAFYDSAVGEVFLFIDAALMIFELTCLWRALISVQRKAELPKHTGAAVALIIYHVIIFLLWLTEYEFVVIPFISVIAYIFIIRSLNKLSKELDEAGYVIRTKPIKVTDRCIVLSVVSVLLVGFTCGYAFGNSYSMEWTPANTAEHENVEEIKDELITLGFPEDVLNDISAEDIAACKNATHVVVQETEEKVNYGITAVTDNLFRTTTENSSNVSELRFTSIGVRLSGEKENWIIFHHFIWNGNPYLYGTESIQLWPADSDRNDLWRSYSDVTGRVLYDKDGETFTSDYYFLGSKTFTSNSVFFGEQTSNDVFASFCMPKGSEHQRGYVAYPLNDIQKGRLVDSWCNYTHQSTPLQYPVKTAIEHKLPGSFMTRDAFTTYQEQFTFSPSEVTEE